MGVPVTSPDTDALLQQILIPIRHSRVKLIATAAGDYAAADVISNSATDTAPTGGTWSLWLSPAIDTGRYLKVGRPAGICPDLGDLADTVRYFR